MTTAWRIGILLGGVAFGVVVEVLSAPPTLATAALELAVGVAYLSVAAASSSRAEAVLGVAAAFTWFIAGLEPLAFASFWHRAVIAHLIIHIAWRGRPSAPARVVIAISYVLAVVWGVWSVDAIGMWVAAAWGAGVLTVVALARRGRRRALALSAAVLLTLAAAGGALLRLVAGAQALPWAEAGYEVCLVAAGILLIVAVRAPALDGLVDAVVRLGERGDEVQDQLARLLGDPHLQIAYWDETRGAYLRDDGVEVSEGAEVRRIDLDGSRAALLVYRGAVMDDALLDRAVVVAVLIRREHARLIGEARTRIAAVTEARRRIAVADALERERFGREMQQSVLEPLSTLGTMVRDDRARELLALATGDLRVLATGLAPEVLAGGLPSALLVIAATAPVPVQVRVDEDLPEPDAPTAACLYFVCSEAVANAVRHGAPGTVSVSLRATDRFELSVRNPSRGDPTPLPGSGLQGLQDRVEALGGSLTAISVDGEFTLAASLPLSPESADLGERSTLEETLDEGVRTDAALP